MTRVPPRRSWNVWFWGLVGAVTAIEVGLLWLGTALVSRTLPCFWAGASVFGWDHTMCTGVGTGPLLYIVPIVVTLVVGASLVVGVTAAVRTLFETRRRVRPVLARAQPARRDIQAVHAEVDPGRSEVVEVDLEEPVCFVHGLLRPTIVISSGLVDQLDDRQLRAVLAHEVRHVAVRDPLKIVAARGLSAAAFPFPVLRDLVDHILLQCELNADEAAATWAGRRTIAETLTRVLFHPRYAVDTAFGAPETARARMARLAGHDPPRVNLSPGRVAASTVSLATIATMATLAFSILPAPPPAYATGDAVPPTDLGWTDTPGPTPDDPRTFERRLHDTCDPTYRMLADTPDPEGHGPDRPDDPLPLVVTDNRGEITIAAFAHQRHAFICQVDRIDPRSWRTVSGTGATVPQDPAGPITALSQHRTTVRDGVLTSLFGTVEPAVDEVTVQLVDGSLVRAATGDGYWLAWWPTATRPGSITAHTEGQPVTEIPPPDITTGSSR